jgi:hypothetical protein
MDCLRSFNFRVELISNISGGTELKQWTTGANQHFWQVSTLSTSTYNIEGYKNINVYGIDVLGTIQTQTNTIINGAIVNDWSIDVAVGGQRPIIGGSMAATNIYAVDLETAANKSFSIGKYTNSLKFASPYESVKFIQLGRTLAQGYGWETLAAVNLRWNLNFVVFYKFEGE